VVFEEYNLNIIDLNKLFSENIELSITNFIYNYKLNLTEKSKDLKYIIQHFIISEILNNLNNNYKNVIIYNRNFNIRYFENFNKEVVKIKLTDIIQKSSKIFKFCLFEIENTLLLDEKNLIYKLKHFADCKKNIDFKKIDNFCKNNKLNDIRTKLISSKTKLKIAK
jgi:hypothetical protein